MYSRIKHVIILTIDIFLASRMYGTYIKFKKLYSNYIYQMPNSNDSVSNSTNNTIKSRKRYQQTSQSSESQENIQNETSEKMLNTENEMIKLWIKYFEKNKYVMGTALGLILGYLLFGRVMGYIHSVTELIVFSILPLKIILHVLCNQNESQKYNNYSNVLLKQMFLIVLTKTMISFIPFLDLIPIIRIISYPVYLILIIFAIMIQTPVTMLNKMLNIIMDRMKISNTGFIRNYLHVYPVYDRLINKFVAMIENSKIMYMRTIRNIVLKYESDTAWNPKDMNKMSSALNELGINQMVDNIDIKSSINGMIKQIN
jgi:hypothetical protein